MHKVLTPIEMQAVDAHMIREQSIPGIVLMEHAAMAVTAAILERNPKRVAIVCGGGNNGGDGLSVLRQLHMHGVQASAYILCAPDTLTGDACAQYGMAVACGLMIQTLPDTGAVEAACLCGVDVIVDALFGTGLSRPLEGRYLRMVERINAAHIPVIAVDIPSGIDGATGAVLGAAVRAQITVTFQYKKCGHLLLPGRMYTGSLRVAPIGLPHMEIPGAAEEWTHEDVAALLPARPIGSHKGKNGRTLLMAGCAQYTGAALMSARAALRAGTGLLHVAVPSGCASALANCPAAICHPVGAQTQWDILAASGAQKLLVNADALALGPGMGAGEGVATLLQAALETKKPLIIDADGLNALSATPTLYAKLHAKVILTPHPGEMARLFNTGAQQIAQEPMRHAMQAARDWGCVVLLKGATSVIAAKNRTALNATGNTGLAKGGSGDVLTGILLALLGQGLPAYEAACAGAYLLGGAADEAYRLLSTRMLLPTDVIDALEKLD